MTSHWIETEDGIICGTDTTTGATFDGVIKLFVVPDDRRMPGIEATLSPEQAVDLIEELRDAVKESSGSSYASVRLLNIMR